MERVLGVMISESPVVSLRKELGTNETSDEAEGTRCMFLAPPPRRS